MAAPRVDVIPNQVFIGCPWRLVKPKYEKAIDDLVKRYPLSFAIVGRGSEQTAVELLDVIKRALESSTFAVFDATHGNANVSLEYGYAEGKEIERAIYLSDHEASQRVTGERAIIADLAGKRHNRYRQLSGLRSLLAAMAKGHTYTQRFENFLRQLPRATGGEKKRRRTLALKIIHALDGKGTDRRATIVQKMLAASYKRDEIDQMIRRMHGYGLIASVQGPYSTVTII